MNDDGYTLADTLAALAILGLSLAAVTTGMSVLTKVHAATEISALDIAGRKRASVLLDQLLAQAGPFTNRSEGLEGDQLQFSYPCGNTRCGARLEPDQRGVQLLINRAGATEQTVKLAPPTARFVYFGSSTSRGTWPQSSDERQRLRSVGLVDGQTSAPLAHTMLWVDQPVQCEFDVVAQDCR